MRTGTAPPPPPTAGSFSPGAPFVQPAAPKARRQPALLALGVALIGVSAVGFVYWNKQADTKVSVLVVAKDVAYGQKITADDLVVVRMVLGTGVKAVDARSEATVLAEVATTQLHAGSVLSPADVGTTPPIPTGDSLTAATLKPGTTPAGLVEGRAVILVVNGLVADGTPNAKPTPPPVISKGQAGDFLAAGNGYKQVTYKAVVVNISGNKVTLAVAQADATIIEELSDEDRLGIVIPPSGS